MHRASVSETEYCEQLFRNPTNQELTRKLGIPFVLRDSQTD